MRYHALHLAQTVADWGAAGFIWLIDLGILIAIVFFSIGIWRNMRRGRE